MPVRKCNLGGNSMAIAARGGGMSLLKRAFSKSYNYKTAYSKQHLYGFKYRA
jgi:hypothetical protein